MIGTIDSIILPRAGVLSHTRALTQDILGESGKVSGGTRKIELRETLIGEVAVEERGYQYEISRT